MAKDTPIKRDPKQNTQYKNDKRKSKYHPVDFTEQDVLDAIEDSGGIIKTVAENLGCGWNTARRMIRKFESTLELFNSERTQLTDDALRTVRRAIHSDDVKTAKWVLSKLDSETFGEKLKLTGNIAPVINIIIKDF